jgi:hypothetical protein
LLQTTLKLPWKSKISLELKKKRIPKKRRIEYEAGPKKIRRQKDKEKRGKQAISALVAASPSLRRGLESCKKKHHHHLSTLALGDARYRFLVTN